MIIYLLIVVCTIHGIATEYYDFGIIPDEVEYID